MKITKRKNNKKFEFDHLMRKKGIFNFGRKKKGKQKKIGNKRRVSYQRRWFIKFFSKVPTNLKTTKKNFFFYLPYFVDAWITTAGFLLKRDVFSSLPLGIYNRFQPHRAIQR